MTPPLAARQADSYKVIYFTRQYWLARLPPLPAAFRYTRLPSTFADDAAAGLHSSTFDLSANIEAGDARAGLDDRGKRELQRLMKTRGIDFDEARRLVVMERFRREGIGEDGRPRDPKFVSFS